MNKHARNDVAEQLKLLKAVLRSDLALFTERCFAEINGGQEFLNNWHMDAIAHELTKVAQGETRRLLITLPPRSLKSITASVAFPAWLLGHDPGKKIICVSYGGDLATAHANHCRKVMASPWYQGAFPDTRIDPTKNTEGLSLTTAGGQRLSTTTGGALTGQGGSVIIIDDPMKAGDAYSETSRKKVKDWYDTTLLSRLDNKSTGAIILVMQRLHVDDLAGHVLAKGGWRHLDLPAIAPAAMDVEIGHNRFYRRKEGELLHPERDSQEVLDELRASTGTHAFSAQYQQRPVPAEGNLIKWSWFQYYDTALEKKTYSTKIVQSWDTASKATELADYSVGITAIIEGRTIYVVDVVREKLDYPDLKRKVIKTAKRWKADTVLVEDKGSGISLIQDLKRELIRTIPIKPEGDKIVRMATCSAQIESGSVLLPRKAVWMNDFQSELLAFPEGHHDDQVDALSQLINWDRTRSRYTLENVG
ncbi:phage terminase large subunit [Ruegeria meonggei]|uniref:phage terminase large subunit n=1 Tax=Ruegeria meonggei TaxID=1446476 RepID=UPI00366C466E